MNWFNVEVFVNLTKMTFGKCWCWWASQLVTFTFAMWKTLCRFVGVSTNDKYRIPLKACVQGKQYWTKFRKTVTVCEVIRFPHKPSGFGCLACKTTPTFYQFFALSRGSACFLKRFRRSVQGSKKLEPSHLRRLRRLRGRPCGRVRCPVAESEFWWLWVIWATKKISPVCSKHSRCWISLTFAGFQSAKHFLCGEGRRWECWAPNGDTFSGCLLRREKYEQSLLW